MCACLCACECMCVCMCVCVCEHSVPIFGPLYKILVLVAHGLKSALTTLFVLFERMCEGVGDSMFFFICRGFVEVGVFPQTCISLFSCFPQGITFLIQDRQSRYAHVGNLSQFVYLLRSIECMFYNYFLGLSAEFPDLEVLP